MLKKFVLALMPLTLLATAAHASDDLDLSNITAADIEIVEDDLNIDLDVVGNDENSEEETALEACFRRVNYGRRSWGRGYHNGWGNSYYDHCHSYCQPLYSHHAFTYCPPVYRAVCAPIYSYYWGCH